MNAPQSNTTFQPSEGDCYPVGSPGHTLTRRLAQTPSLLPWVEYLALLAERDVPVLLTGETGTGKSSLARLLHDCSPRAGEPFVTVPCGALPPALFESEFFGHVRGAFTGAERSRVGKIAAAGRGTLLLDEIDTLGLQQQAALLRALDSGEYEPVGSNETLIRSCRMVAASNADLGELVEKGEFRADLYYRLHVLPFHLPALRERTGDIATLARGLLARFGARFGKELLDISPEALSVLESYSWPGNIRELDNVLQHAVLLSRGPVLLPRDLPPWLGKRTVAAVRQGGTSPNLLGSGAGPGEEERIRQALEDHGLNRVRTARELGISRVTLYKKMKKYGLVLAQS